MSAPSYPAPSELFDVGLHWMVLGDQRMLKSLYVTILVYVHKNELRDIDICAPEDKLQPWEDTFVEVPRSSTKPPMRFTSYEDIFNGTPANWHDNLRCFIQKRKKLGMVILDDVEGYLRRKLGIGRGNVANFLSEILPYAESVGVAIVLVRHKIGGQGAADTNLKENFKNLIISCSFATKSKYRAFGKFLDTDLPLRSCMELVKKLKGTPLPQMGLHIAGKFKHRPMMMLCEDGCITPNDPKQRCVTVLGGDIYKGFCDWQFSGNIRSVCKGPWGKNYFGEPGKDVRINTLPMPFFKNNLRDKGLLVAADSSRSMVRPFTPSGLEHWADIARENALKAGKDTGFAFENTGNIWTSGAGAGNKGNAGSSTSEPQGLQELESIFGSSFGGWSGGAGCLIGC